MRDVTVNILKDDLRHTIDRFAMCICNDLHILRIFKIKFGSNAIYKWRESTNTIFSF